MDNNVERERKADIGDPKAQCEFGDCCFGSEGVPPDHEEAANWCLSGDYDMCFVEIIFNLGLCYYRGKCIPCDYDKAYFWFVIAADNGHEEARVLMICYDLCGRTQLIGLMTILSPIYHRVLHSISWYLLAMITQQKAHEKSTLELSNKAD